MKKIIFSLLLFIFGLSVNAQQAECTQECRNDIQQLVQKVDSLEHELTYLRLNYELNMLKADISIFTNDVNDKCQSIETKLYNKIKDRDYQHLYQKYYKSFKNKQQSFVEYFDSEKLLVLLLMNNHTFSDTKLNVLKQSLKTVEASFDTLQNTMELFKVYIDAYIDLL